MTTLLPRLLFRLVIVAAILMPMFASAQEVIEWPHPRNSSQSNEIKELETCIVEDRECSNDYVTGFCRAVRFSDEGDAAYQELTRYCVPCNLLVSSSCPMGTSCDAGTGLCLGPDTGDSRPSQNEGRLINLLNADTFEELLALVLRTVVQIGSILLVLSLVWVGFLFVAAQGNEEKIRSAKDALLWVVVGGLLLIGAQALTLVIQATVNSL